MNKNELIMIRDGSFGDRNFVLATFLRGIYYGETVYSLMEKKTFMDTYNHIVNNMLDNPSNTLKMACLKDDPDTILGYALLSGPDVLQYVFVKKQWRGIGIAKDLVPGTVTTVTHLTRVGLSIMKNKNLAFNPFLI